MRASEREREREREPEITQVYDVKTKLKGEKEKKERKKGEEKTKSRRRLLRFLRTLLFSLLSLRRVSRLGTRCTSFPPSPLSLPLILPLPLSLLAPRMLEKRGGEVDVCEDVFIMARVKTIRATCLDVSRRGIRAFPDTKTDRVDDQRAAETTY